MALIEIDGLPNLKMGGSFHGYVSHNQMVMLLIFSHHVFVAVFLRDDCMMFLPWYWWLDVARNIIYISKLVHAPTRGGARVSNLSVLIFSEELLGLWHDTYIELPSGNLT